MANDLNNLISKVRKLQTMLEAKLDESLLVRDLKKYAATQQKVLKKKINSNADIKRVVSYVEKRRKDLDKVAKNLPKEVATMGKFVAAQKKEFEKLGKKLLQELSSKNMAASKGSVRKAAAKRTRAKGRSKKSPSTSL